MARMSATSWATCFSCLQPQTITRERKRGVLRVTVYMFCVRLNKHVPTLLMRLPSQTYYQQSPASLPWRSITIKGSLICVRARLCLWYASVVGALLLNAETKHPAHHQCQSCTGKNFSGVWQCRCGLSILPQFTRNSTMEVCRGLDSSRDRASKCKTNHQFSKSLAASVAMKRYSSIRMTSYNITFIYLPMLWTVVSTVCNHFYSLIHCTLHFY